MDKKDRLGKFRMSEKFYKEHWDVIKSLFLEFRTVHIETDYWNRNEHNMTFFGYSDHFDEIGLGEITPMYNLIINFSDSATPIFNFERIKPEYQPFSLQS